MVELATVGVHRKHPGSALNVNGAGPMSLGISNKGEI
jgi:hypothetical protein